MPFLSKTKGAIVNTSSASGTTTFPLLLTAYGTVKGGLAHFTKYAAAHGFKHSGVRANAIAPGTTFFCFAKRIKNRVAKLRVKLS